MFLDVLLGRNTFNTTLSYANCAGRIAFVLAVFWIAPGVMAQTGKESIDVPPHSKLLFRAVGRGDQVYGCVNGSWALKAPEAKLLDREGSVIGRHFTGLTWELNDGSWVKVKAVATQVAPDATAVPWLLPEAVGGAAKLQAVRFIQRTGTRGAEYEEMTFLLQPGDLFVAFTDGIIEAWNATYDQWGLERFEAVLAECAGKDPAQVVETILRGQKNFIGPVAAADDMTLMVASVERHLVEGGVPVLRPILTGLTNRSGWS